MSSTDRTQEHAKLSGEAIDSYKDAIRREACVLAIDEDEMSVGEARRFLKLDEKEQLVADWGPSKLYYKRAVEWFEDHRSEFIPGFTSEMGTESDR